MLVVLQDTAPWNEFSLLSFNRDNEVLDDFQVLVKDVKDDLDGFDLAQRLVPLRGEECADQLNKHRDGFVLESAQLEPSLFQRGEGRDEESKSSPLDERLDELIRGLRCLRRRS